MRKTKIIAQLHNIIKKYSSILNQQSLLDGYFLPALRKIEIKILQETGSDF